MSGVRSFNRRQWLTILVFAVADFCAACCVSLQSPFYPQGKEIFCSYVAYVLVLYYVSIIYSISKTNYSYELVVTLY